MWGAKNIGNKKFFRDPIHGLISFDKKEDILLLKLIDTYEFQRLRRIRQLGVSWVTYPTAVHTRFSHSLGVAYLAGRIFDKLKSKDKVEFHDDDGVYTLSRRELKLLLQTTALLHDIGHGPFSHAFESIINEKHEEWSIRIIEDSNSNINKVILHDGEVDSFSSNKNRSKFPQWIGDILKGIFPLYYINEIISSQLDADRLDYLLRDAYMCGVDYAKFDLEWILNNISIGTITHEGNRLGIVVDKEKGMYSLESFIVSRYHMYERVYFHKTTRAAEKLIHSIFRRLQELIKKNRSSEIGQIDSNILDAFSGEIIVKNYIKLDDFLLISYINKWSDNAKDDLLRKLCSNFINRYLYKLFAEAENMRIMTIDQNDEISRFFKERNLPKKYLYVEDDYKGVAYKDDYLFGKKTSEESGHIWLKSRCGGLRELAEASDIIKALRNNVKRKYRIYCDRGVFDELLSENII